MMPKDWLDKELRQMAHDLVEKHYNEIHKPNLEFKPGETTVSHGGRVYDAEEMKNLVDACLDFWLTEGRFTQRFQQQLAQFLDVKFCLTTNSGSSANLLAMSALTSEKLGEKQLREGDEVITVACGFPTTVNPIIQNRLIPVFLDVEPHTCNIQADAIEEAITPKTKAISLAHTLGNPFNLETVLALCKKHNLFLLEDNCDALGSKYDGKYTGTFGDIGTSSFYPPHHITMGEGGAVYTNSVKLKRILESFRDWGRDCWCDTGKDNTCGKRFEWSLGDLPQGYDHKFIYSHIGYNFKLTDMQASVGCAQLKKLPKFISARKKNWEKLSQYFQKYEEFFILPRATPKSDPSWFGFLLTVREKAPFSRKEIVNFLEENKIRTRVLFGGNLTRQPSFKNVQYRVHHELKNSDRFMNSAFWIGVHPGITDEMLNYVCDKLDSFFNTPNRTVQRQVHRDMTRE